MRTFTYFFLEVTWIYVVNKKIKHSRRILFVGLAGLLLSSTYLNIFEIKYMLVMNLIREINI